MKTIPTYFPEPQAADSSEQSSAGEASLKVPGYPPNQVVLKVTKKRISKNRNSEYNMINNDTRLKIVFET